MRITPARARSRLGLSESDRLQRLYVIGYKLPDDINAHVPTIADAGIFPYFKPNILGTPGYTDPWHPKNDLLDDNGHVFNPKPCPEVVHAPATVSQIQEIKCLSE